MTLITDHHTDFAVVGSGCAGLFIADALARLGLRVTVLEANDRLAGGPTTRNGGFVHAGGFHAGVIEDHTRALLTARRCMDGAQRLAQQFPEAVQRDAAPIFLLAEDPTVQARTRDRWAELGLPYQEVSPEHLHTLVPGLHVTPGTLIARTADFPIDWRMVCQFLATRARQFGATFFTSARVTARDGHTLHATTPTGDLRVHAQYTVYATGAGTAELTTRLGQHWDTPPQIALWKSHVLALPRVTSSGALYLDPGRGLIMPQRNYTLFSQSQEDTPVSAADYDVIPERIADLHAELRRALPNLDLTSTQIHPHACLKPALITTGSTVRRVDSQITRLSPHEWLVFPGKATEAPLASDELIRALPGDVTCAHVTPRPGDEIAW